MDRGSVETNGPELQRLGHLRQQQDLDEQILEFRQEGFAKGRQGVVVGVQIAGEKAKWHGRIGRPFQFASREHAGSIAVEQQGQQDVRRLGLPAARTIPCRDNRQVELGDRVHDKACQMVGWKTVAQPHRHVQCRVVISGFEDSTHTCQCTTDRPNRRAFLSDKLLDVWAGIPTEPQRVSCSFRFRIMPALLMGQAPSAM